MYSEQIQPDGTVIRMFSCKITEDSILESLCDMEFYEQQREHDEACRRFEPNRSEFRARSKHKQLGLRVNRIPSTAKHF